MIPPNFRLPTFRGEKAPKTDEQENLNFPYEKDVIFYQKQKGCLQPSSLMQFNIGFSSTNPSSTQESKMKKIQGSSQSARTNKRHITMCLLTLALLVLSDSFQGSYQTGMNGHVHGFEGGKLH